MSGLRRRVGAVGAAVSLALVGTGAAFAATPQQIYRDYGDNGKLDRRYSAADLDRAFSLLSVMGTDRRPGAAPELEGNSGASGGAPARPTERSDRRLPFSALDAVLFAAGAAPLLLIGAGLRRRLGGSPHDAPVVGR